MQDTFLQIFVFALSLLMNPNRDHSFEELDEALKAGIQEREQALSRENEKLNQEIPLKDNHELQEQETTAELNIELENNSNNDKINKHVDEIVLTTMFKAVTQIDAQICAEKSNSKTSKVDDYIWIVWKIFSVISLIHLIWKCRQENTQLKSNATKPLFMSGYNCIDSRTLQILNSRITQANSSKKCRGEEFLDGFVGDLLQSLTKVCSENGGMAIGTANLEDLHHVIVPLSPPEPYVFKCFYSDRADDALLDMQICGHIELVKSEQIQNGCCCQASHVADEMICLLHKDFDKTKGCIHFDKLFCEKYSKYLSKAEVAKWFQSTLRLAWSLIAFKYEFEVCIGNNTPGAVLVRFKSGEKINFTINPVVAFDTHSHFFITPCSPKNADTCWSLSISKYEDMFLKCISKLLPINSCHMQTLDIALFLHKRQTMLTGHSGLKGLHYRIALMHLLLTKNFTEWRPALLANRLHDILNFMIYSLKTKQLHHVLIGNSRAKGFIQLPADLVKSNPVNLFHPLVVHKCIYKNTMVHFQELLRNAPMVIKDHLGINMPDKTQ